MSGQMSNGARAVMMLVAAAVFLGGIGWGIDALTRRADLGGRIDELAREAGLKSEPPPAPAPEPPVADEAVPPTVAPDDVPVRVGGETGVAPRLIVRVPPKYTEVARRARIQGVVILEAEIDRFGRVTSTRVIKGLPMGLSEAAQAAVGQWQFAPAEREGRWVASLHTVTVNFRLE